MAELAVDEDRAAVAHLDHPLLGRAVAHQIGQVVDAMFDAGLVDVRIAFVELRDDIEGSELGETMCLERGMTIRIFSQETLARRWLIYGD